MLKEEYTGNSKLKQIAHAGLSRALSCPWGHILPCIIKWYLNNNKIYYTEMTELVEFDLFPTWLRI